MLKKILKLFVGLILLKAVFNESCLHRIEWKKFKTDYRISFDNSNNQSSELAPFKIRNFLRILILIMLRDPCYVVSYEVLNLSLYSKENNYLK